MSCHVVCCCMLPRVLIPGLSWLVWYILIPRLICYCKLIPLDLLLASGMISVVVLALIVISLSLRLVRLTLPILLILGLLPIVAWLPSWLPTLPSRVEWEACLPLWCRLTIWRSIWGNLQLDEWLWLVVLCMGGSMLVVGVRMLWIVLL